MALTPTPRDQQTQDTKTSHGYSQEVVEALDAFLAHPPSVIARIPEGMRTALRSERLTNMTRIATILCPGENPGEASATDLCKILGRVTSKIPALKDHFSLTSWQTVYFLTSHLTGPKVDHATPLKEHLSGVVNSASPPAVQRSLKATLDLIDFTCFNKLTREQEKALWLRPEVASDLEELVRNYRISQDLTPLESLRMPAAEVEEPTVLEDSAVPQRSQHVPATSTGLTTVAQHSQSALAPSLAEAVLPQLDRKAAQIAIQVDGGLLFAQAIEGQQIVISNSSEGISLTLKKSPQNS